MTFPHPFEYLATEPGPVMLKEALAHFALHEIAGPKSNDEIMGWAREAGAYFGPGDRRNYYDNDDTPWCALFMTHCAKAAGWQPPNDPLAALSWARFGNPAPKGIAMLGDVLVKARVGGGHVGIYVGEDASRYFLLGGNQGDRVSIAGFPKGVFTHVRRAPWKIAQPANVRQILVGAAKPAAPVKQS